MFVNGMPMGGGMPFGNMGGMGRNGMGGRRQMRPHQSDEIAPQSKVMMRGLTGRTELNGGVGSIADYDRSRDRYIVAVGGGEAVALKPQNLLQLVRGAIVTGVSSRPELNGRQCNIIGYNEETERWDKLLLMQLFLLCWSFFFCLFIFSPSERIYLWICKYINNMYCRYILAVQGESDTIALKPNNVILPRYIYANE